MIDDSYIITPSSYTHDVRNLFHKNQSQYDSYFLKGIKRMFLLSKHSEELEQISEIFIIEYLYKLERNKKNIFNWDRTNINVLDDIRRLFWNMKT